MARGEAERGEGRRGREALEDAVEIAGVAEVLQPRGRARAGSPKRRRRRRRRLRGRGHHRLPRAGATGAAPPRDSTRPPPSSSAPPSTAPAAANSSDRIAHQRAPQRNGHRGGVGGLPTRARRLGPPARRVGRWEGHAPSKSNRTAGRRGRREKGGKRAVGFSFPPTGSEEKGSEELRSV